MVPRTGDRRRYPTYPTLIRDKINVGRSLSVPANHSDQRRVCSVHVSRGWQTALTELR